MTDPLAQSDDIYDENNFLDAQTYHERLDSFLEQFSDYGEYDRFLSSIEISLTRNKPRIICPSVKSIRLLLTLSTIDHINRGPYIRREILFFTSSIPLRYRANNILRAYCDIILKNEEGWNLEDLAILQNNLVESLQVLKSKDRIQKKPQPSRTTHKRSATKRNYTEVSFESVDGSYKKFKVKEHQRDKPSSKFLDSPKIFKDSLDVKRSSKILGSLPIEELIISDKIWDLIRFCLSCSNSQDLMKRKFWEIWENTFHCIFQIIKIDFEQFKRDTNKLEFKDTLIYHFISTRQRQFVELLFVPYDSKLKPFQTADLHVQEGQLLTDFYKPTECKVVNTGNYMFIRKVLLLAFETVKYQEEENEVENEYKFLDHVSNEALHRCNLFDLQALFLIKTGKEYKQIILFLVKIIITMISQLSGSGSNLKVLSDFKWLENDTIPNYIINIIQNVPLNKVGNSLTNSEKLDKYQILSFLILKLIEIWIKFNFNKLKKLPDSIIIELLNAAEIGDKLRFPKIDEEMEYSTMDPLKLCNAYNRKHETNYITLSHVLKSQLGIPSIIKAESSTRNSSSSAISSPTTHSFQPMTESESEIDTGSICVEQTLVDTEEEDSDEIIILNEKAASEPLTCEDGDDSGLEILEVKKPDIRSLLKRSKKCKVEVIVLSD